ncbi:winged helix-turn-helix domain-containing protein [Defluviimonas sp. SAOS-178_SWC]|uniref:winged helix-turn-helix domain-containing protein n=1 Tax=Defluviimonas sp. SAOS-178_SWC TaxID=3121287 RepID=UPI0032216B2E
MSVTSLAYEQPVAGPAPVVQIDVGSFLALMSMVARHVDLTSVQRQLATKASPVAGNVTAFKGASAAGRADPHPVAAAGSGDAPEAALVNMLIGAFAPTAGTGSPDVVPLAPPARPQVHPFGKTWLHVDAAKLVDADGSEIPLTAMEFRLLKLFAENRGRVLNRDQILEGAHDRSWDPFDRSIDIRISRIRRKIEHNPQKPEVIRTVRGIGYIYDPA